MQSKNVKIISRYGNNYNYLSNFVIIDTYQD